MGDGAQELRRVALLLQRIVVRPSPISSQRVACSSHFCPAAGEGTSLPATTTEAPVVIFAISLGAGHAGVDHDLEVGQAGAVVEFEEGKALGVAPGADPAGDVEIVTGFLAAENVLDE